MPKKCSICTDSRAEAINKLIREGKSFRAISCQILGSDKHRESVRRHTENCLRLDSLALIKDKKIGQAINHYQEITEQLEFAKDLRVAAREYLSDENGKLTLIPRSDEIEVVYQEWVTKGEKLGWVKKTESLDILLENITQGREIVRTVTKHIDIRQFALNAIGTVDTVLDKIAKVQGLYTQDKENAYTLESLLAIAKQNSIENKTTVEDELQWIVKNRNPALVSDDVVREIQGKFLH